MNVSIKTSCFRSKTHPESSCRQSKPDQSSSAFHRCRNVEAYHCRWVNFGSCAKACHGKFFYSAFLLFLEQQGAHEYYSLTKKSGVYHTSFNHQRSKKARVKQKKDVCKSNGVTRWRELESTYFVTSISARNTSTWACFSERRFQPLIVGGFLSNQRESISRCPKSQFPSTTQNRQTGVTFQKNTHSLRNWRGRWRRSVFTPK